jgi:hypothetical protein
MLLDREHGVSNALFAVLGRKAAGFFNKFISYFMLTPFAFTVFITENLILA